MTDCSRATRNIREKTVLSSKGTVPKVLEYMPAYGAVARGTPNCEFAQMASGSSFWKLAAVPLSKPIPAAEIAEAAFHQREMRTGQMLRSGSCWSVFRTQDGAVFRTQDGAVFCTRFIGVAMKVCVISDPVSGTESVPDSGVNFRTRLIKPISEGRNPYQNSGPISVPDLGSEFAQIFSKFVLARAQQPRARAPGSAYRLGFQGRRFSRSWQGRAGCGHRACFTTRGGSSRGAAFGCVAGDNLAMRNALVRCVRWAPSLCPSASRACLDLLA